MESHHKTTNPNEQAQLLSGATSSLAERDDNDSTNYSTSSYQTGASHKSSEDDSGSNNHNKHNPSLRRLALNLSLYTNLVILLTKLYAYGTTFSLSVLAALIDSVLDVVSQGVLQYAESHSSKVERSSALYPAGAARLEPVGVLTCAALMGMASFEVLKQSLEVLLYYEPEEEKSSVYSVMSTDSTGNMSSMTMESTDTNSWSSFWGMVFIVLVKVLLMLLCKHAMNTTDSTMEALYKDHLNDCLSNAVAALALLCYFSSPSLWFLDPVGAVLISLYIIYSWYSTGREQIEQLTGKAAPVEFLDELYDLARNFDERMEVDVCRAYHFGPKFLVELEVVLPKDTLLFESHDLGMELQYEIEGKEEVERCFVHIDYETRPYDEHVVSKVPELRERLIGEKKKQSSIHSV